MTSRNTDNCPFYFTFLHYLPTYKLHRHIQQPGKSILTEAGRGPTKSEVDGFVYFNL